MQVLIAVRVKVDLAKVLKLCFWIAVIIDLVT